MPLNKLTEAAKRRHGVDPEAPAPTSEELLAEIRDLLEAQNVSDKDIPGTGIDGSARGAADADYGFTGGGRHQA